MHMVVYVYMCRRDQSQRFMLKQVKVQSSYNKYMALTGKLTMAHFERVHCQKELKCLVSHLPGATLSFTPTNACLV